MTQFTANPVTSSSFFQKLNQYMEENVLGENKAHKCNRESDCKHSCEIKNYDFYFGQLHHVGELYDVKRNDKPFRIMVSGGEYGSKESRSMKQRQGDISLLPKPKNPHMRSTLSVLQILFGQPLNLNDISVNINGKDQSIFTTFALANFLLCTGKKPHGFATDEMEKNCGHHYKKAIEILKPQIIILQGVRSREFFKNEYDISLNYDNPHVETIKVSDNNVLILPLKQIKSIDSYVKPAVIDLLEKYDQLYM